VGAFNDILAALEDRITSLADIDVVLPNDKRKPRDNREYIQFFHLPGDTVQACLGDSGLDMTEGIFQINIMGVLNTGRSQNLDLIADHFARGRVIEPAHQSGVKLRITSVSMESPSIDGTHYKQPISVSWQTFTAARL